MNGETNGDRFDQDLAAVLREEAPRVVPESLRLRVAAVSASEPAGRRPVALWRQPAPLLIGAAAVVLAALALGPWRPWQGSGPGVGGPSASPSTAPSGGSSSEPSAGAVVACRSTDLTGRILRWEGAAGSRIASVQVTNASAVACLVGGTPGLQLVDGGGRLLLASAPSGGTGPVLELAPAEVLATDVEASNYCGPDPSLPIGIAITLPDGGGSLLAAPAPGVSSDLAVPPCLGSTGGHLAMNGWRR